MSISSIASSPLYTNAVSSTASVSGSAASTGTVTGPRHHHRGGGEDFMQSMLAALSQSGLTTGTTAR